jgi:hypothetical protein
MTNGYSVDAKERNFDTKVCKYVAHRRPSHWLPSETKKSSLYRTSTHLPVT